MQEHFDLFIYYFFKKNVVYTKQAWAMVNFVRHY
jgi:hypothetical protein